MKNKYIKTEDLPDHLHQQLTEDQSNMYNLIKDSYEKFGDPTRFIAALIGATGNLLGYVFSQVGDKDELNNIIDDLEHVALTRFDEDIKRKSEK